MHDTDMVKAYRAAKAKRKRLEQEKTDSISYYNAHKTEIETGRRAALILSVLCRCSHEAQYLTVEDILSKADNSEINFFYKKLCEGRQGT